MITQEQLEQWEREAARVCVDPRVVLALIAEIERLNAELADAMQAHENAYEVRLRNQAAQIERLQARLALLEKVAGARAEALEEAALAAEREAFGWQREAFGWRWDGRSCDRFEERAKGCESTAAAIRALKEAK